jgi:protease II
MRERSNHGSVPLLTSKQFPPSREGTYASRKRTSALEYSNVDRQQPPASRPVILDPDRESRRDALQARGSASVSTDEKAAPTAFDAVAQHRYSVGRFPLHVCAKAWIQGVTSGGSPVRRFHEDSTRRQLFYCATREGRAPGRQFTSIPCFQHTQDSAQASAHQRTHARHRVEHEAPRLCPASRQRGCAARPDPPRGCKAPGGRLRRTPGACNLQHG